MSEVVDLAIPAHANLIVLARLTAATVAARAEFGVEEIEDIRLAVEELCVPYVGSAGDGRLQLRFERDDDLIEISCRLRCALGRAPAQNRGRRRGHRARGAVRTHSRRARRRARTWHRRRARLRLATKAKGGVHPLMPDDRRQARQELRDKFAAFAATRDRALRDELVSVHMGLAHHLARRFANRGEPFDDLLQVASVGILTSVDRFDPSRGVEFSTFATQTVIGELKRHFRDKGWMVRAPRRCPGALPRARPGRWHALPGTWPLTHRR